MARLEYGIAAGCADNEFLAGRLCHDRDVLRQDRQIVEGRGCLREFFRIAKHLVDVIEVEAQFLPARNLTSVIWADVSLRYIGNLDVQARPSLSRGRTEARSIARSITILLHHSRSSLW